MRINDSTTASAMTANTQTMLIGFAGSKNCTLVNNPGAAIEWLASPAIPATAPQIKPLIRLVYTIHGYLGWLSVAIMGALWPLLVMTGMHRVFTPTIIQTIAETGKEGMVMPSEIGANLSLGGSSLAVAWKTKNPELRQTALAAAASAIMAGISEPALYGVAIRLPDNHEWCKPAPKWRYRSRYQSGQSAGLPAVRQSTQSALA